MQLDSVIGCLLQRILFYIFRRTGFLSKRGGNKKCIPLDKRKSIQDKLLFSEASDMLRK